MSPRQAVTSRKNRPASLFYAYFFMELTQTKSEIVRAIQELPDDATLQDAMERLYFLAKIERGLEQSEGQTVSHEEIKNRFRRFANHYVTEEK